MFLTISLEGLLLLSPRELLKVEGSEAIQCIKHEQEAVGIWCKGEGTQLINFRITQYTGENFGDLFNHRKGVKLLSL